MKSLSNFLAKGIVLFTMGLGMVLLAAGPALAVINITVTGSWTQSIDKNNLTGGPGTDLTSTFTSAQNVNLITISGAKNKNDNWQINIRRIDTAWNGTLQMFAKRTSSGTGQGSISGGQAYIQVTQNATTFFTGAGNLSGISVQLQLTGASLAVSPNQYSTTIQYTVIDTP
jgi:predicted metalloprotease